MTPVDASGFTAIIADDEVLARDRVAKLLADCPTVSVVAECASGTATLATVRDLCPDLLFLDVQMPGLSGFELLAALDPDERPFVIFSTAYDEYALAAFDVHAIDYLLKPFADDRFHEAVRRAIDAARTKRSGSWQERLRLLLAEVAPDAIGSAHEAADPNRYIRRFPVRTGERLLLVDARNVDWIEAERDHVRIHVGAESFLVRGKIGGLESRLDPERFLRIHRSVIVQLTSIRELFVEPRGGHAVVLRCDTRLRVGRRYRDHVLTRLGVHW